MSFRFTIRHVLLFMAALCIALSVVTSLHRSSLLRIKEEQELALHLSASTDSVSFTANGDVWIVDRLFLLVEHESDVAPIASCVLFFRGIKNSLDLTLLERFPSLTYLELYQCDVTDEEWSFISRLPSLTVVELSAGTSISEIDVVGAPDTRRRQPAMTWLAMPNK